jgi:hypothetical protein
LKKGGRDFQPVIVARHAPPKNLSHGDYQQVPSAALLV